MDFRRSLVFIGQQPNIVLQTVISFEIKHAFRVCAVGESLNESEVRGESARGGSCVISAH